MNVLVAPDKSKGSISAVEVTAEVAAELRAVVPGVEAIAGGYPRLAQMQLVLATDDWFRRAG